YCRRLCFCLSSYPDLPALPSFPTRRSSDLYMKKFFCAVALSTLTLAMANPVCQHRPEPHDFEITYISGRSGDQKCQSQSPLLTRWSNPIQHLKNGLAESLRLNINYRFFRKPMLAS